MDTRTVIYVVIVSTRERSEVLLTTYEPDQALRAIEVFALFVPRATVRLHAYDWSTGFDGVVLKIDDAGRWVVPTSVAVAA